MDTCEMVENVWGRVLELVEALEQLEAKLGCQAKNSS